MPRPSLLAVSTWLAVFLLACSSTGSKSDAESSGGPATSGGSSVGSSDSSGAAPECDDGVPCAFSCSLPLVPDAYGAGLAGSLGRIGVNRVADLDGDGLPDAIGLVGEGGPPVVLHNDGAQLSPSADAVLDEHFATHPTGVYLEEIVLFEREPGGPAWLFHEEHRRTLIDGEIRDRAGTLVERSGAKHELFFGDNNDDAIAGALPTQWCKIRDVFFLDSNSDGLADIAMRCTLEHFETPRTESLALFEGKPGGGYGLSVEEAGTRALSFDYPAGARIADHVKFGSPSPCDGCTMRALEIGDVFPEVEGEELVALLSHPTDDLLGDEVRVLRPDLQRIGDMRLTLTACTGSCPDTGNVDGDRQRLKSQFLLLDDFDDDGVDDFLIESFVLVSADPASYPARAMLTRVDANDGNVFRDLGVLYSEMGIAGPTRTAVRLVDADGDGRGDLVAAVLEGLGEDPFLARLISVARGRPASELVRVGEGAASSSSPYLANIPAQSYPVVGGDYRLDATGGAPPAYIVAPSTNDVSCEPQL